jgi:hypothetical protein
VISHKVAVPSWPVNCLPQKFGQTTLSIEEDLADFLRHSSSLMFRDNKCLSVRFGEGGDLQKKAVGATNPERGSVHVGKTTAKSVETKQTSRLDDTQNITGEEETMSKISMGVAMLAASLALSGAAFASNETPATGNAVQPVAAGVDSKVQKAAPDAGKGTVVAEAKGTEQKAGQEANKTKPETTAKADAKTGTPAPVEVKDNNAKK